MCIMAKEQSGGAVLGCVELSAATIWTYLGAGRKMSKKGGATRSDAVRLGRRR